MEYIFDIEFKDFQGNTLTERLISKYPSEDYVRQIFIMRHHNPTILKIIGRGSRRKQQELTGEFPDLIEFIVNNQVVIKLIPTSVVYE